MRLSRSVRLVVAGVQLLLPPVLTTADGLLERAVAAANATSHVESPSAAHGPQGHPADCALCQVIAAHYAPPARGVVELLTPARVPAPTGWGIGAVSLATASTSLARAPPVS